MYACDAEGTMALTDENVCVRKGFGKEPAGHRVITSLTRAPGHT